MDPVVLLGDHRGTIDDIIRRTSQRRRLAPPESERLSEFVLRRLADNDYEILRKFNYRCSAWTYLALVIERLSLDFCAPLSQQWQPSPQAVRLGPTAVLLERLVLRDGHSLAAAFQIARRDHRVMHTNIQLHDLWSALRRAKGQ